MDKNQREARRRQEDRALNRGLLWVGAAIRLELVLLVVKRWYLEYRLNDSAAVQRMLALDAVLRAVRVGGVVLAVACLAWLLVQLRGRKKAVLPLILALLCAALALCAHVTVAFQGNGLQMLFLLVPAWAGLALVYYLYQREFFLSACAAGMSVVGLWFIRAQGGLRLETGLTILGILLVLIVTLAVRRGDGVLSLAGITFQVLPHGTSCTLALISCLVSAAALLLAAAMGTTAAYYLIFLMIAWLFALLVYYTVKMM